MKRKVTRTKEQWRDRAEGKKALLAEWELYPQESQENKRYLTNLRKRITQAEHESI